MPRKSNEQLLTPEQLEVLLNKTAKGFVTNISKIGATLLKNNTEELLYGRKHTDTELKYRDVFTDHNLVKSITYDRTTKTGDSYANRVYFDDKILQAAAEKKTKQYLGRYMNIDNMYVGDSMIEEMWLEDGTSSGLVPRSGANMMDATIEQINDWIDGPDLDTYIEKEIGKIVVERFK